MGTSTSNRQLKEELRRQLLVAREAMPPEEHRRLSAIIVEKLKADADLAVAKVILSYMPYRNEVDLSAFHEWALAHNKLLAFPICLANRRMQAAVPQNPDALIPGALGIIAPDPEGSASIDPADLDCVLVPCLGFHKDGYRLGMGGGYFDRYLPQCSQATTIGIAFSQQEVEEDFCDPWDIRLWRIVTDAPKPA